MILEKALKDAGRKKVTDLAIKNKTLKNNH